MEGAALFQESSVTERAPRTPPLTEFRNKEDLQHYYHYHNNEQNEVKTEYAVSRHRKTRSGIPHYSLEELVKTEPGWKPPESPPPLLLHAVSALQAKDVTDEDEDDEIKKEMSKSYVPYDLMSPDSFNKLTDSESEENPDETSLSLPPTPSCGSHEVSIKGNYDDSDQDTVIEDSCSLLSEDDVDDLSRYNMDDTLIDESLDYDYSSDTLTYTFPSSSSTTTTTLGGGVSGVGGYSPTTTLLFESNEEQTPFVGLGPASSLSSIPEEYEIHLDKSGNHIKPEPTIQRVSLESIELDAVKWNIDEDKNSIQINGIEDLDNVGCDHNKVYYRRQRSKSLSDSHEFWSRDNTLKEAEGKETMAEEKANFMMSSKKDTKLGKCQQHYPPQHHHQQGIEESDILLVEEKQDEKSQEHQYSSSIQHTERGNNNGTTTTSTRSAEAEIDDTSSTVVFTKDFDKLVLGSNDRHCRNRSISHRGGREPGGGTIGKNAATADKEFRSFTSDDDSGCCSGFFSSPLLSKVCRKLFALVRLVLRHWPLITSAILPFIFLFTYKNKSTNEEGEAKDKEKDQEEEVEVEIDEFVSHYFTHS